MAKVKLFSCLLIIVLSCLTTAAVAADKVVVVPLFSNGSKGNATVADVVVGKTFSNSSSLNLTGTRLVPPLSQSEADWPDPRFTDNSDGTVSDNLTGLKWLKNSNCSGLKVYWATANSYMSELNTSQTMGGIDCGDTGGATDWRLPSLNEMESLRDISQFKPALPVGHFFEGDVLDESLSIYWATNSLASDDAWAWAIDFESGAVSVGLKVSSEAYVWAVRGN
jgi:Protein of unknown function (DUF1566)